MEGDEESLDNTCLFVGTSGDLMGNLVKRSRSPTENVERESEELELSLGLSMNGRFGVDPAMKKIRRSSSVSDIEFGGGSGAHAPLARTSSLPPERTGAEKLKNVGGGEGLHGGGGGCSDVKMGHGKFEKQFSSGAVGSRGLQSQFVEGATQTPTKVGAERGPTGLVDTLDMPFVSTRGSGPNNNKIEGFLYRYKKAEEVKIVCVCHGMFLSPAEFVKHGGGGDVAYPLKHIVVSPFPLY